MPKNAHIWSTGAALMRALAVTIPSSVANMRGYGRARRRGIEERRGPRSPPNPANDSVRGGAAFRQMVDRSARVLAVIRS